MGVRAVPGGAKPRVFSLSRGGENGSGGARGEGSKGLLRAHHPALMQCVRDELV